MRTNIKLDVSDAQRNALAQLLSGKPVKRLATREEVAAYVQGMIDRLAPPAAVPVTVEVPVGRTTVTAPANASYQARPSFESHLKSGSMTERDWPSYVRGWNAKPYRSA